MKKIFSSALLWMSIAAASPALAQSNESNLQLKLGAFYISKLNYYGRTDSLASRGFFPLAELWIHNSFYINAAPVFLNNAATSLSYAGTVTTLGYQSISADREWLGNFYVVKPFYKSNTPLVQSSLRAQAGFTVTNSNKIISPTIGGDVKLSDNFDFGVTGGVDHIFRIQPGSKSVLVIDPSARLNAGTQQFTQSYYKKAGIFLLPPAEELFSQQTKTFSILSYEISVPLILSEGKFQVLITPSYVIPQNVVNTTNGPQRGDPVFYATAGAKFIL